jgi:hypothetical protein
MENLQEDPDYATDQNGRIIDLYGEPISPERIEMQRDYNRFHNARVDVETKL